MTIVKGVDLKRFYEEGCPPCFFIDEQAAFWDNYVFETEDGWEVRGLPETVDISKEHLGLYTFQGDFGKDTADIPTWFAEAFTGTPERGTFWDVSEVFRAWYEAQREYLVLVSHKGDGFFSWSSVNKAEVTKRAEMISHLFKAFPRDLEVTVEICERQAMGDGVWEGVRSL